MSAKGARGWHSAPLLVLLALFVAGLACSESSIPDSTLATAVATAISATETIEAEIQKRVGATLTAEAISPVTGVPITKTPRPATGLEEQFDKPGLFTQTADTIYVSDGWVYASYGRSGGVQYLYRTIPTVSGDVRLTVRGQVDSWTNNCRIRAGIGRKLNEVDESEHLTSISINFGWVGGGCGRIQATLPPGALIDASGVAEWDFGEGPPACNYWGNWLRIEPETPYEASLTISEGKAVLSVPGIGTATGKPLYDGPYNILFVGNTGNHDWPECSVRIDYVIVEPLH